MSEGVVERWSKKYVAIDDAAMKWKAAGLGTMQKTLEADVLQVSTNREAVQNGRKNVSQKTRDFAKLPTEEKPTQIGGILKTYQGYIDELSKSLKHVEGLFFEMTKAVQSLPDPYPLLARLSADRAAVMALAKASEESEKLRVALAERESELSQLKNQEVTIQQLRNDLAAAELKTASNEEHNAAEAKEEMQNVLRQWQHREQGMMQEVAAISQECRKYQLQSKELAQQVATLRGTVDELHVTKDEEVQSLVNEMEALTVQLALREREHQSLLASKSEAADKALSDVENEFQRHSQYKEMSQRLAETEEHAALMEKERAAAKEEARTLRQELEAMATTAIDAHQHKRLQLKCDQLVQRLEVSQAELLGAQSESDALRQKVSSLEQGNAKLAAEVTTLENEIRTMMRDVERSAAAQKQQQKESQPFNLASVIGGGVGVSSGINIGGNPGGVSSSKAAQQGGEESGAKEENSTAVETLAAVAAQRDRYRQRLLAAEEASMQEVDNLKLQVFSLQQENEQLQQYIRTGGGGGGSGSSSGGAGGVMGSSFAVRVPGTHGAIIRTSHLDRVATLLTRFVVANEYTRRIFLVYLLALHGFVFLVLFTQLATWKV